MSGSRLPGRHARLGAAFAISILAAGLLSGCLNDGGAATTTSPPGATATTTTKPPPTTRTTTTGTGGGSGGSGGAGGTGGGGGAGGDNGTNGGGSSPNGTSIALVWGDPSAASVRPGVRVSSDQGQCTSNFVFASPDNRTIYLGVAAHCFGTGVQTDTNGCTTGTLKPGAPARVAGASKPAFLAYSSWATMQALGERDGNACAFNDFALVRLDPADRNLTHPAMLHFGGPTGTAADAPILSKVLTYGNSGLRGGVEQLNWHEGYSLGCGAGGWTCSIDTAGPGLPGDSGSGVILGDGQALGVLVTIGADGNGVTTLTHALAYAADKGGIAVRLATWQTLDGGLLP